MQGLWIKYGEYSAHSQYLQQQNLLEEDQIYHHFPLDLQLEMDQLEFTQNNQSQQSHLQQISYAEYIHCIITLDKGSKGMKQTPSSVIIVLNYVFQDILLYHYHINHQKQCDTLQFIKIYKWMIISRLLIFLIIAIYLPQIALLSIGYLIYLITQRDEINSQIVKSNQLIKSIGALTNQLRIIYSDLGCKQKRSAQRLGINIDLFVKQMQKQFGIENSTILEPIDRFNSAMFKLQQTIKSQQNQKRFIGEYECLKRIYYLWMLKKSNRRKEGIKTIIQSIIQLNDKHKEKNEKKNSYYNCKSQIYFSQLFVRLSFLLSPQSNFANIIKHKQNLINILSKQLQFKQIIYLKQLIKSDISQQNQLQQSQIAVNSTFPTIQNPSKQPIQSLVYQDGGIHNIDIKDHSQLKLKLQQILQKHQQQQRKLVQKQLLPKQQKKLISEKPQRSFFSFGIPFLPPARDMSAYYIQ